MRSSTGLIVGLLSTFYFFPGSMTACKFGAQASACPPAPVVGNAVIVRDVSTAPQPTCNCQQQQQATVQQQQGFIQRQVTTYTEQVPVVTQQAIAPLDYKQQVTVQRDVATIPAPTYTQQREVIQRDVTSQGYSGGYSSGTIFRQAGTGCAGAVIVQGRGVVIERPVVIERRRDVVTIPVVTGGGSAGSTLDVRRGLFNSRTRATGAAAEIAAANNTGQRGLFRGR